MEKFPLEVFVFSYNRGPLLSHCLDSLIRHIPGAKVTVVDDNSSDPETQVVLNNLPGQVDLMQPKSGRGNKYGGLYHNLQKAYERAESDFILFTQDDAQAVRRIEQIDLDYFESYFNHFGNAAFLSPVFPYSIRRSKRRGVQFSKDFPTYFYQLDERFRDRSVTMYYADITIASTRRLRKASWNFQQSEKASAAHARRHFGKMGAMVQPFLCQLPEVPFYRSGHQTWGMKQIIRNQKGLICGFRDMTSAEVQSLRDASPRQVPYAEDWLQCTGREPRRPLRHKAADAHSVLKQLHKIELFLRRFLRPLTSRR
ncbi:MAG TPA: glycosyltransferase family A protein [Oceanipulchritudo sp.]|nr:glycosyltransferase family A protein [Oceanipulchritudo sp.]